MLHVKWKQLNKRTQPTWSLWKQKPIKILTRKSCCYFCRHSESASKNIPKQYLFIFMPFHFLPQDPLLTRLLNVYYSLASLRRVVEERKLCSSEQSLQLKLQPSNAAVRRIRLCAARGSPNTEGCSWTICSPSALGPQSRQSFPGSLLPLAKGKGQTFLIGRPQSRRSVSFSIRLRVYTSRTWGPIPAAVCSCSQNNQKQRSISCLKQLEN